MTAKRDPGKLWSIEEGPSARTIAKMLRVLYPDARTVLDLTYGNGNFWSDRYPSGLPLDITGVDLDPSKGARVADFRATGFESGSYDVCIFDPPYLSNTSKAGTSRVGRRFSSYPTEEEAIAAVQAGCREAWRLSKLGIIVKVQDMIHGYRFVDMTGWVRRALPVIPYGRVDQIGPGKIIDPKWTAQLSVWSCSTTFLAFRHGDQRHIRRTRKEPVSTVCDGDALPGEASVV